jgi:hypothetical protein
MEGFEHFLTGRPVIATLMNVTGNVPSIILPCPVFSFYFQIKRVDMECVAMH